jgi:hypothetical protein
MGTAAGAFGQQMGANIIGAGNAAAAGQVGSANAITSGLGQGLNFYQNQQFLNNMRNPSTNYNTGALSNQYMTSPGYFGGTSYGE